MFFVSVIIEGRFHCSTYIPGYDRKKQPVPESSEEVKEFSGCRLLRKDFKTTVNMFEYSFEMRNSKFHKAVKELEKDVQEIKKEI